MLVLASLGGGLSALGQTPTFPPTFEREPFIAWLTRDTDIVPDRVVAVTPQAVTAVVSSFPSVGGQGPRVVIRAEALSGETHARTGALSWHVSVSADCANHRVRLGETTGYPERNLLGGRRVLRPAESDWRAPEPGTALDNAWRVACDPDFVGPFQDPSTRLARNDASPLSAPTEPAPRPAAKPVRPATTPAAPPAAATQPPSATVARGVAVQVGSFPDRSAALAALAALGDGRTHALESAVVGGRTWFRAVVSGFASASEAAQYCAQRQAAGAPCLVRAAPRR